MENQWICNACRKQCKSSSGLSRHKFFCKSRVLLPDEDKVTDNKITTEAKSGLNDTAYSVATIEQFENFTSNVKDKFDTLIQEAYEDISNWKRNLFQLPKGHAGKEFVREITCQIEHWTSNSPNRNISLKCLMVMPCLLLQQINHKAKSSDRKNTLERRMTLWKEGRIEELLSECREIQRRLEKTRRGAKHFDVSRTFNKMMMKGRINGAIRLLGHQKNSSILPITSATIEDLKAKHPNPSPINEEMMLQGPINVIHPVIFEKLNDDTVLNAAMNIKGAAGVSQFNAEEWRRMLGSSIYGTAGLNLRKAIARMAKSLCTQEIPDPESLEALLACRLIPLSKDPGVRPIGIGEILRRIIAKSVIYTLRNDLLYSAGNLQLCAGQKAGCEIAIHAVVDLFNDDDNHGILQIDAHNAFNSINRKVAIHNMKILCPEFATFVSNSYHLPARLFVTGGLELQSNEGTTQGDPVAMPMYALAILPLLSSQCGNQVDNVKKVAFADDFAGVGTLIQLKEWSNLIENFGPYIGYFPNPSKSVLIVKDAHLLKATEVFSKSEIQITSEGNKHLGACVGNNNFKREYVSKKVRDWVDEIKELSKVANSFPHSAYAAFTRGIQHKYTYFMRTIPNLTELLEPLEYSIRHSLIPALFNGYECSDIERQLFSLPPKLGGLGIHIPTIRCQEEYEASRVITKDMIEKVKSQDSQYDRNVSQMRSEAVKTRRKEKHVQYKGNLSEIKRAISDKITLRMVEAANEIGASSWLTSMPLKEHGFY